MPKGEKVGIWKSVLSARQDAVDDIAKFDGNSRFTGLYVNEESYYAINLKLGYNLTKEWTIWPSIAGGMAKNIGRNVLYSLSIGYKLN